MSSINEMIRRPHARLFRRAYIKRRLASSGQYEDTWQEITDDVKSWGTIKTTVDITQYNKFKFSGFRIKVANSQGKFNSENIESSFWSGYSSPQRSLVRIEVGYLDQSLAADGTYTNTEYPQDGGTAASAFVGVIVGDMPTSDKNEVILPVQPLTEVFRQYPAQNLSGYTSTGLTAQQFLENVRDHQDGNGDYVFRPFFGDTTTGFNIASTTVQYGDLNTSGAENVIDANVWEIIEGLSQAETKVPYVSKDGVFNFVDRVSTQSVSTYDFYGAGFHDRTNGHNVKNISKYGFKYSKFYSRVQVKFEEAETTSSYSVFESSLTVATNSLPWLYGHKTINIENLWIPTDTAAQTIAESVYNQVSNLKEEIAFTAPLIPQLEIFDRISVSYDTNYTAPESLWDANNWALDEGSEPGEDVTYIEIGNGGGASGFGGPYSAAVPFTMTTTGQALLTEWRQDFRITTSVTGYITAHLVYGASITTGTVIATAPTITAASIPSSYASTVTSAPLIDFSNAELTAGGQYWVHYDLNNLIVTGGGLSFQRATLPSFGYYYQDGTGGAWLLSGATGAGGLAGYTVIEGVDETDALIWDKNVGDAISLDSAEFRLLSIENNLDKLQTKITGRKT